MITASSSSSSDTIRERTEVLYGTDNVIDAELQFFSNAIPGHLNGIWTTLKDTRSEKMSGYGRMSDHDKELLSPLLNLLVMYEDISKLLR